MFPLERFDDDDPVMQHPIFFTFFAFPRDNDAGRLTLVSACTVNRIDMDIQNQILATGFRTEHC